MIYREFGKCGFRVSVLGFGAGHIGGSDLDEKQAEAMLSGILDLGINLVDTARSYGLSEERIGRYLSNRRGEFILSSKGGYTYRQTADWSYEATMGSVEESLIRLKTDYIDIYHLHSCDVDRLRENECIAALEKAREQGKIRCVAYSGENEALAFAIRSGRFDSIQCSVSLFDQASLERSIPESVGKGLGVIAKRPLGNAVWRYSSRPDGHGHVAYFDRWKAMQLETGGLPWHEMALRFTAFTPGVSTIITGSADLTHLAENTRCLDKGPLPSSMIESIRNSFLKRGNDWPGLI
ncbi:MAG TPA: aldo/keto reductase [Bacteroidales bacterium]|nr:aldo/keto reductase [Bacteroidales bacterium]HPS63819.1 aldo/keto reductase [Bacteroidales bacterium]